MKEAVGLFLQREIDQKVTPGAVIRVRHKGQSFLTKRLEQTVWKRTVFQ